nr:MAG TPA: hypothetical protein [Caudoviricetes sp.]
MLIFSRFFAFCRLGGFVPLVFDWIGIFASPSAHAAMTKLSLPHTRFNSPTNIA